MNNPPGLPGFLFLSTLVGLVYFIPSIIAKSRNHHRTTAIFLINLLSGWTALGWIVALIWSATAAQPWPQQALIVTGPCYHQTIHATPVYQDRFTFSILALVVLAALIFIGAIVAS